MKTIPLPNFHIPDYPNISISINNLPPTIIDHKSLTPTSQSTHSLAICTILHNWCPDALTAFLDLDAWFSFTWIRKDGLKGETIEIGRVGNQITFGSLDASGDVWRLMISHNIGFEGEERGMWVANVKECMQGERDVSDVAEIEKLSAEMVRGWLESRIWETGKKVRHEFYVEYAPMDVWGDGIAMNPHWLYAQLVLTRCTTCGLSKPSSSSSSTSTLTLTSSEPIIQTQLSRCGKCGTATYCSSECQKKDWPVHKHICSLGLEERGQMLAITRNGGLIAWDRERMFAEEGGGELSKNPYFAEGTVKRCREEAWLMKKEEYGDDGDDGDDGERRESGFDD